MDNDIFESKRYENETREDYKARLKGNRASLKEKLSGRVYWPSAIAKTFTKEKANEMARRYLEKEGDIKEFEKPKFQTDEEEAAYDVLTSHENLDHFHKAMRNYALEMKKVEESNDMD